MAVLVKTTAYHNAVLPCTIIEIGRVVKKILAHL